MPHADSDVSNDTMAAPTVNGETPTSAFFAVSRSTTYLAVTANNSQHLTSYPVISDSISTFKANPLGAKALSLSDQGYNAFAKPVLPYFTKPYQYVSPYVAKADSIGDSTLSKIDSKFPVVKKPTGEIYDNVKGYAFFPVNKATEGKDYVFKTYTSEVKKVGGEGLITQGKAAVTTTLIVSSDALSWLSNFLAAKKAETKEVVNEKINN
jgi:hypothetical protein